MQRNTGEGDVGDIFKGICILCKLVGWDHKESCTDNASSNPRGTENCSLAFIVRLQGGKFA